MNTTFATLLGVVLLVGTVVGMKVYQGEASNRSSESANSLPAQDADEDPAKVETTTVALDTNDPATLDGYLKRAIRHTKLGKHREALRDLEIYLKHRPHDLFTAQIYGRALLEAGEFERAAEFYEKSVASQPRDVKAQYSLAWAYEQSGQFARAMEGYERVLVLDPRRASCRNNVAWILATAPDASLRNGKKALEMAFAARQLHGRDEAWLADTLAAAFAETGDFAAAVKVQQWALNAAPGDKQRDMQKRLELYRQKKPFRLPKRPGDKLTAKKKSA